MKLLKFGHRSVKMNDFATDHLEGNAKSIADAIVKFLREEGNEPTGGGCRAFYDPKEWRERGEAYGRNSLLILVHDGGDLAPYLDYDYDYDYMTYPQSEALDEFLRAMGYYTESCTSWYSAVYPLSE